METSMFYRSAIAAALTTFAIGLGIAIVGAAHADAFKPIQAQHVDLGAFTGIAYYTAERDGHHLVITVQAGETGTPMRFAATLAPGQGVTLSVPRHAGEAPLELHFVRQGERIVVNGAAAALSN
jgi:hypothetical protein